ncbi:hypothetical protein QWZ03_18260 [Chitinimonas viridis]|uniref:Phage tail assembly protein n=1 Tax=Chitinimonas viridis TaxID=664880 RepID=A0ABT8BB59_9NEIS|nr:hypothetical protein [Chitinimonas viridis]MDN3578714.1 hypothetical protein [Chitinimonas viridis]
MSLTIQDQLLYGLEYEGVLHKDVELRLPTIADNIAALEEVGPTSNIRLQVAMWARSMVKLGGVPVEQINTELLLTLVDEDFDVLTDLADRLKKKRRAANGTLPAPASLSSPLAESDSPSSKSSA